MFDFRLISLDRITIDVKTVLQKRNKKLKRTLLATHHMIQDTWKDTLSSIFDSHGGRFQFLVMLVHWRYTGFMLWFGTWYAQLYHFKNTLNAFLKDKENSQLLLQCSFWLNYKLHEWYTFYVNCSSECVWYNFFSKVTVQLRQVQRNEVTTFA